MKFFSQNRSQPLDKHSEEEYISTIVSPLDIPQRVKPHSSLAAWRRAQGYTQRQAADFLGVSQAYYSKLERHDQAPRRDVAKRLTERTGVPLDELLGIAS